MYQIEYNGRFMHKNRLIRVISCIFVYGVYNLSRMTNPRNDAIVLTETKNNYFYGKVPIVPEHQKVGMLSKKILAGGVVCIGQIISQFRSGHRVPFPLTKAPMYLSTL